MVNFEIPRYQAGEIASKLKDDMSARPVSSASIGAGLSTLTLSKVLGLSAIGYGGLATAGVSTLVGLVTYSITDE